jgi:hypothetical protein
MADDATVSNASSNIIRAINALTQEMSRIRVVLEAIAKTIAAK